MPSSRSADERNVLNGRMLPPFPNVDIAYLLAFFPVTEGGLLIPAVELCFPLHLKNAFLYSLQFLFMSQSPKVKALSKVRLRAFFVFLPRMS